MPYKKDAERAERKKVYARRCYLKNRAARISESAVNKKRMIRAAHEYVLSILLKYSCVDCGEADPVVLDFDHRDPELKSFGISQMIVSGYSAGAIQMEIDKCDVSSANCHRRRTAKQRGWFRSS